MDRRTMQMGQLPGKPVEEFIKQRQEEDDARYLATKIFDPKDVDGTVVVKMTAGAPTIGYELRDGKAVKLTQEALISKISQRL